MAIRRCEKGHFYDTEKYSFCPVCMAEEKAGMESGHWESEDKTIGLEESDKTVGYLLKELDAEAQPVVGWLVCVRGAERGRDWRLSYGRNDIGKRILYDQQRTCCFLPWFKYYGFRSLDEWFRCDGFKSGGYLVSGIGLISSTDIQ